MNTPTTTLPSEPRLSVALPAGAAPTDLGPLLAQIHEDARRSGARVVSVDMRGAGSLGIAGLQHFVAWLLEIQDLPRAQRYAVHFIGDGADHYQKRGLEALRACAEDAITIAFVEGNA